MNNYPFSDAMQFCSRHTKESDIIEVDQCPDCHASVKGLCVRVNNVYSLPGEYHAGLKRIDPFQNARPCWLSPLRQIALIEAANELNERFEDVANDRFRNGSGSYVLKSEGR